MTVCIAAITENNKVIAITDKMITISGNDMTTTFEISDSNKVSQLSDKVLALWSGFSVQANEILKRTKERIADAQGELSVLDIANMVKESYSAYWDYIASNFLLMKYKINLTTFMTNQNSFDSDLVKQINEIINRTMVDVSILVAGIDNTPRIYLVDNSNSVSEHTQIGYAIIGAGMSHATLSLIESDYNSTFDKPKAIYTLLEAKKRAEFDPSVGKQFDIAFIDDEFKKYDDATIRKIDSVFKKSKTSINREKKKYFIEIKNLDGI